jgi:hypothetical protein
MGLQETQIVVQFAGGVETKKDRKGVLPTKLLALENSIFSKAVSLVKRNGYADLGSVVHGSVSPLPQPLALGRREGELLAFTADTVYSYVDESAAWVAAGSLQSVIVDHEPAAKTGSNQTLADVAVNDGVALYGWEDSRGGVWYALQDDETGRALVVPTLVSATAQRPRAIAIGDYLHLVYAEPVLGEIRILSFSVALPLAVPTPSILVVTLSTTMPAFDVVPAPSSLGQPAAVLAWAWPVADNNIGLAYIHQSGALGGTGTSLPLPVTTAGTVATALVLATNSTHIVVAWSRDNGQIRYRTYDDDLATVHAIRTLVTESVPPVRMAAAFDGRTEAGAATFWVWYEMAAAAAPDTQVEAVRSDVSASALTVHESWVQRSVGLGSGGFTDGTDAYVHLLHDSTLYRTYYTQRARGRLIVSRILPGLAGGLLSRSHLPNVQAMPDDSRTHVFAAVYVTDVESMNGTVFAESGIRRVSVDFDSPEAFRSVQLGRSLYVAGGLLYTYDGQRVVESGFHYAADNIVAPVQDPPTGTGIAPGTYNYVFVYENVLGNGEVERGPLSPPITVVIPSANKRVTFAIPTERLTSKPNARIGCYRSLDGDSATYARVSSLDPTTVGQVNGFVANSTTVDTVSFIDEMTDDTLLEQEPLYTNGGIVENDPLGSARLVAGGKNRLFVVDAADPLAVYFSQELAEGYAVEFSPALRFTVDPYGGDITGIVVLDDALVIFKATAIFQVSGPGPFANPDVGGGWTSPQLITSDVGCISPDSIGYTPVGIVFQSSKGICLLGRDQSVRNVGDAVDAYSDQTITACTLVEDETQIRLLTSSGLTLLYDYAHVDAEGLGQWSTFTNHEGQDAVVVGGVYHYLRNDGQVWQETPGVYRDNNTQIRRAEETAWLKLAGHAQGWQRLWWMEVLGEFKSAHTLKVSIAYDYEDGWSGVPILIDTSEGRVEALYGAGLYGVGVYGGSPDTRYQFEIHVGQECEAVRFRFEDVEATGAFGASYELSELILTGGVERSTFQIEHARSW